MTDRPDIAAIEARLNAATPCSTPCDPDCDFACHEEHEVFFKRTHRAETCSGHVRIEPSDIAALLEYVKTLEGRAHAVRIRAEHATINGFVMLGPHVLAAINGVSNV